MKYLFIVIFVFLSTSVASAKVYTCEGGVDDVVINPAGTLIGNLGTLKWVYVCSTTAHYNNITPEACKSIYALLLTASAGRRKVTLWFDDNLDCNTHKAWDVLTGWYFGPALSKDTI